MPDPEPFRFTLKVWMHPQTQKMFVIPVGNLNTMTGQVFAYAMSDDQTFELKMTVDDWNALPYHSFKDDGVSTAPPRKFDPSTGTTSRRI